MVSSDAETLQRLLERGALGEQRRRVQRYLKRAMPSSEDAPLLCRVIGLFPDDLTVLRRSAQLFMGLKDWPQAATLLDRAVALDELHLKTRRRLVSCYIKQGQWDTARRTMEPAMEHPRAIWRDAYILAGIHASLGNDAERLRYLRRAWATKPADSELQLQLVAALRQAGQTEEAEEVLRRAEETPQKLTVKDVVGRVAEFGVHQPPGFIVNIGCRDGKSWGDPCYELFQAGYGGLAVDAGHFPDLFKNLPQAEVQKRLNTKITPLNVVGVLREAETPARFDLLHISIGCFEGVLLQPILEVFQPQVVHIAVNTEIPPPLKFAVQYHEDHLGGQEAGFWGCSVSFVTATCREFGYVLLQVDFSDQIYRRHVLLVRQELMAAFGLVSPPDERGLYDAEPYSPGRFLDLGIDTRKWREIRDPHELLAEVREACLRGSAERFGKAMPFVLTV